MYLKSIYLLFKYYKIKKTLVLCKIYKKQTCIKTQTTISKEALCVKILFRTRYDKISKEKKIYLISID